MVGAVGVSPGGGVSRKRGVNTGSAPSQSVGIGTVGTGGGRSRGRGGGRSRPRPWHSRRGGNTPGRWPRAPAKPKAIVDSRGAIPAAVAVRRRIRVEMRSEDGITVWGTGEPGEAGADVVGFVSSTESAPCVELLKRVG